MEQHGRSNIKKCRGGRARSRRTNKGAQHDATPSVATFGVGTGGGKEVVGGGLLGPLFRQVEESISSVTIDLIRDNNG